MDNVSRFLATVALIAAVPTIAAPIAVNLAKATPTAGMPAVQGMLLASQRSGGQAFTFAATFNQAVYRNADGMLDFYFQVLRTGAGSIRSQEIRSSTVSSFGAFTVDGYASFADPDGGGLVVARNNPTLVDGTASGFMRSFGRSPAGDVIAIAFGANGLTGSENSATCIFRTSAVAFGGLGHVRHHRWLDAEQPHFPADRRRDRRSRACRLDAHDLGPRPGWAVATASQGPTRLVMGVRRRSASESVHRWAVDGLAAGE